MGSSFSTNQFPVDGRTVLITGASTGLGLHAAQQLAAKGANVIIVARSPATLQAGLEQIKKSARSPTQRFHQIEADVTTAASCAAVIAAATKWNDATPPDIVWCCSGSAHPSLFIDTPPAQLQTMMDSNYFSCAYMAHATLNAWLRPSSPLPTENGPPAKEETAASSVPPPARHLIFTASFVALYSFAGFTPYSPSKAAIRSLADSLSQEMNLYAGAHPTFPRVRVHTVFPATMPTQSLADENRVKTDVTKMLEEGDQVLSPDECARRAIAGLERGEELVATSGIIRLVMTSVLGGAVRGELWDMDRKVWRWGREYGDSGMMTGKKRE
ncbi:hypothetical protein B0T19DRAFT_490771 [Cercophora scortea]|uniref:3-dehydrosphinganine reductase n=1 Tax=Cercophora scortea TaxID=314031 RepID=A0AAE0MIJ9_9PEZI|nr:hypothetical protein B0T19DRAFT_490771 [Cercophora scortea]